MPNGKPGFDEWYAKIAAATGLNPNPDDPAHFYDYRKAYEEGVTGPDPESKHWPSKYKTEGHPRMVVDGVNTKTGLPATGASIAASPESLDDIYGAELGELARERTLREAGPGTREMIAMGLGGLGEAISKGYGRGGARATPMITSLIERKRQEAIGNLDEKRRFAVQNYLQKKAEERALDQWEKQKGFEREKMAWESSEKEKDRTAKAKESKVKLMPGQEHLDKKGAENYNAWIVEGGYGDAIKNLAQLGRTVKYLNSPSGESATGPWLGMQPDWMRKMSKTGARAVAMKQGVEDVVQRSMRPILGAQFTENEGVRLIRRAYDDRLSPRENARRVERLMNSLQVAAEAKLKAARYFQQNGTMVGYEGIGDAVQAFRNAFGDEEDADIADVERETAGESKVRMIDRKGRTIDVPRSLVPDAEIDGFSVMRKADDTKQKPAWSGNAEDFVGKF